ncbi:MAG: hypothetical protein Q4A07_06310 [Coriobacteriales bacterium]|nr:hypothetical protein [Coriobacteriales bacterium]
MGAESLAIRHRPGKSNGNMAKGATALWSKSIIARAEGHLAFLYTAGVKVIDHRHFDAKQPLCVAICKNEARETC